MPQSTADRLRIAVVGYGYWGSKHVRVFSAVPGVTVTVVDSDEDRLTYATAQYPAARVSASLAATLPEVDAVVVATPPGTHAAVARQAIRAGCDVLVEKPLATSVADAGELVELADRHGVQLMTGHTFEYNAAVWKLKELIRSGDLGRILYINAQRLSLGRYQADVNVVWDLAPHDISIASFLLDEMPSTVAVWAQRSIGYRHADVAYMQLGFPESGTNAFVHVSWLNPRKVRTVTVVGERKMAVYDDMSDNERVRVYDIGADAATVDDDPLSAHAMPVTYRTGDIVSPYIEFTEPLLVQDQHFVDCVRSGTQSHTSGERGLEVVRVLEAADLAMASRQSTTRIPISAVSVRSDRRSAS